MGRAANRVSAPRPVAAILGTGLCLWLASCDERAVYLVPGSSSTAPVEAGPPPPDSGAPPAMFVDGGRLSAPDGSVVCGMRETVEAERQRLGIYAMVDRSGSMWQGLPTRRWDVVATALESFVQSPDAADLELGLQYFPLLEGLAMVDCAPQSYADPAVPIDVLSDNAANVTASLGSQWSLLSGLFPDPESIVGATPTNVALKGAVSQARTWADDAGNARGVVLLVTDGEPAGACGATLDAAEQEASAGVDAGVLTFVLGVGGDLQALDDLARAGGTDQAFLVSDQVDDIVAALAAIRDAALPCTLPLDNLMPLEPDRLNVTLAAPSGNEKLFYVDAETGCHDSGGWYYDDPSEPTAVRLCDSTCRAVRAHDQATLELEAGCPTRTGPTR